MKRDDMQQELANRQKEFKKSMFKSDKDRYEKLKKMRGLASKAGRPTKMYDKTMNEISSKWPNEKWK